MTKFISNKEARNRVCPKCGWHSYTTNYNARPTRLFGMIISNPYKYMCTQCKCRYNSQLYKRGDEFGALYEFD